MKRYICLLLFILFAGSFYSCSEDPVLSGGDFNPTVTSPEHDCGDTDECSSSSVTMSWGGNDFALTFSYRYKLAADAWPVDLLLYEEDGDGGTWSAWSPATEIIIDYLNEGDHIFEVKSRFEEGIDSDPSPCEFEINAVIGPALRFYPLYKQVSVSSQFTMDIYAEDVVALTGAEIAFTYDNDFVSFNSAVAGSKLLTATNNILIEESQTGSVVLTLATYEDNGIGITGSGSLVQLTFTALTSTPSPLDIEISNSSFYIKESNEQAEIENSFLSLHNARLIIE